MFLIILTFISAISISLIAAGYSIIGLATLFAGAATPIIAMGSALEVGKLVAASWLYHNWRRNIPKSLKAYLFTSIIVLIFITSVGIFGFLSKAHLDQVKPTAGNTEQIALIDKKIKQEEKIIERAEKTLAQLDKALDVYIDKEYVSRGLKERNKQKEERDLLNKSIDESMAKIADLNNSKSSINIEQLKLEADVGPLKYVAELIYGDNAKDHFDSAVRIIILILIFVFDPLAVLLLIASQYTFNWAREQKGGGSLPPKSDPDNSPTSPTPGYTDEEWDQAHRENYEFDRAKVIDANEPPEIVEPEEPKEKEKTTSELLMEGFKEEQEQRAIEEQNEEWADMYAQADNTLPKDSVAEQIEDETLKELSNLDKWNEWVEKANEEAEKNPEEPKKELPDTKNRIFYSAEVEDQKKTPEGINYMKKEGNKQVRKTSTPKS